MDRQGRFEERLIFNEILLQNKIQYHEEQADYDSYKSALFDMALDSLAPIEKTIIHRIFFLKQEQIPIARELRRSQPRINQIKKQALNKLKKHPFILFLLPKQ